MYVLFIKKEEGKIDWDMCVKEIYNKFRVFKIWLGIFIIFKEKFLKIYDMGIV